MRELLPELENWLASGKKVALATVVSTWGSAPRPPGSFMAVSEDGEIAGSVSGGCVEGAIVEASKRAINLENAELLHFGVADETAWDVGLACGGEIDIFVQPLETDTVSALLPHIKADRSVTLATVISGQIELLGAQLVRSEDEIIYRSNTLEISIDSISARMKASPSPTRFAVESNAGIEYFINPINPSPTLIMIGGVHIAIALAEIAHSIRFRTVLVDPRRAFGTTERFAHADKLIQAYPGKAFETIEINASTAIASLSHDPKIDDPALIAALNSPAFYIGALGSAKTQKRRLKRLAEGGVSEEALQRIEGPIGLDIGALTPEEIALAIMAQVVAAYRS